MSNYEKPRSRIDEQPKQESGYEKELQRDRIFRILVSNNLLNTVDESLEDTNFSPLEVSEFNTAIGALSGDKRSIVFSIPFEIREKLFNNYHQKIERGEMSVTEMVNDILQKNKQRGFALGYHLSNVKIPKLAGGIWEVVGDEVDDRDNMPMAYYSEDYVSRYRKKLGEFLYIVRADFGPNSSHKRDLKNNWGRASSLSIIDECDMQKIEHEIDELVEKENATP